MPKVNLNPEQKPKISQFTQPDVTSSEEDSQPAEEEDLTNQEEDEFTGLDQSSYITAGYFVPYARENRLNFNSLRHQISDERAERIEGDAKNRRIIKELMKRIEYLENLNKQNLIK